MSVPLALNHADSTSPSRSASIPFSEYVGEAGSVRVPSVQVSSTRMSARSGRTAAHKQARKKVFRDQERIKCERPVLTIMEESYRVVADKFTAIQLLTFKFNRAGITVHWIANSGYAYNY